MLEKHEFIPAIVAVALVLSGVYASQVQAQSAPSGDTNWEALCKDKTVHVPKGGVTPADKIGGGKTYVNSLQGKTMQLYYVTIRKAKNRDEAKKLLAGQGWCYPEEKKNCGAASYVDEKGATKPVCDNRCEAACDSMKPPVPPSSSGGGVQPQPANEGAAKGAEQGSGLGGFAEVGKKMLDALRGEVTPLGEDIGKAFEAKTPATTPDGSGVDPFGEKLREIAAQQVQEPNAIPPKSETVLGDDLVFRDSVTGQPLTPEELAARGIPTQPEIPAIQNPLSNYESEPWDPGGLSQNTFGDPVDTSLDSSSDKQPAIFGRDGCLSTGGCPVSRQPTFDTRAEKMNSDELRPVIGGVSQYNDEGQRTASGEIMRSTAESMACMMCANGEIWRLDRLDSNGEIVRSTYAYVNDSGGFAKFNGGTYVDSEGVAHPLGRAWDVSGQVASNLGFQGYTPVTGTPIAMTRDMGFAASVVRELNQGYSFSEAYARAGGASRGIMQGLSSHAIHGR